MATSTDKFSWNKDHAIGTCSDCGEEMSYNVPRLGPKGGFIHKNTGSLTCGDLTAQSVAYTVTTTFNG